LLVDIDFLPQKYRLTILSLLIVRQPELNFNPE